MTQEIPVLKSSAQWERDWELEIKQLKADAGWRRAEIVRCGKVIRIYQKICKQFEKRYLPKKFDKTAEAWLEFYKRKLKRLYHDAH